MAKVANMGCRRERDSAAKVLAEPGSCKNAGHGGIHAQSHFRGCRERDKQSGLTGEPQATERSCLKGLKMTPEIIFLLTHTDTDTDADAR